MVWAELISYYNIGRVVVAFFGMVLALMFFALVTGLWMYKREKLFLPKFVLGIFYTLYSPIVKVGHYFGVEQDTVDRLCTSIRNKVDEDGFKKTKFKDRLLFLPQCLRAEGCPAPLTRMGVKCKHCGLCSIDKIKKSAEELGYRVFIVPGGSFVERIIKKLKPRGVFGVACPKEVQMSEMGLSGKGLFLRAVPLSKDGCISTEVDSERVIEDLALK